MYFQGDPISFAVPTESSVLPVDDEFERFIEFLPLIVYFQGDFISFAVSTESSVLPIDDEFEGFIEFLPLIVYFQGDSISFAVSTECSVLPVDDEFEGFIEFWVHSFLLGCSVTRLYLLVRRVRELIRHICVHVFWCPAWNMKMAKGVTYANIMDQVRKWSSFIWLPV